MEEVPHVHPSNYKNILLDQNDPNSLFHLVPLWFWDALQKIPQQFLLWTTDELRKEVKPGLTVEALRSSFWVEYNTALETGRKMVIQRIHAGICGEPFFYERVMKTPLLMAWMLNPPENYKKAMDAILNRTTERLFELINQPFITAKGVVDVRVMALVLQAHKHVEERVVGSVVQKVEHRNLNVNLSGEMTSDTEDILAKRIAELRNREQKALGAIAGSTTEEKPSAPRD